MKTTAILLITLFSFFSLAQQSQNSQRARQVAVAFSTTGCLKINSGNCQNGHKVQSYVGSQIGQLPQAIQKALYEIAYHQSQIWGDTILEGDFFADGKVEINKVKILSLQNKVVGFQITYFEKAWYTGNCTFHHNRPETLNACRPGRIFEASFVTGDAKEAQVDENQFAKFVPQD